MGKDNKNILVLVLVLVIVLLLGFIGYLFLIQPAISGLVVQGQNEAAQYIVSSIAQQVAKCPTEGVPLTIANQTINLVALECYKQQTQTQPQTP